MFVFEGELMQGELYSALKNEEQQTGSDSSTTFNGEMHFYELVEDTKDGIWLVQVSANTVTVQTYIYNLSFKGLVHFRVNISG